MAIQVASNGNCNLQLFYCLNPLARLFKTKVENVEQRRNPDDFWQ